MSLSLIAAAVIVVGIAALFGPRLAGQFMAWQETQRLVQAGADPDHINPSAQHENFDKELAPVWAFNVINGAGQIGRAPVFHNTRVEVNQGLIISQDFDPGFEKESTTYAQPASQRYNNASLIGFQGYQPTPVEDVLFETRMQVSPNFYGSAGFMLQPQGTILSDGMFKGRFGNQAFTLFGVCFLGAESNLFGKNGATAQKVINWWPDAVETLPVNMYETHTYQLRLHWVNDRLWRGTISVNGQVVSVMSLPPLGPVEVHIWGDNYLFGSAFNGTPQVDMQNGETKWVRFESVSAWTEAVRE